jgi:hypothetical protein
MSQTKRYLLSILIATAVSVGCAKHDDPEQRLRALIGNAERAAEKKEVAELRGYISERYTDEDGRDRRAVESILRIYLLRNENIHLLTRIANVSFPESSRAHVAVYAAMAARPIAGGADLSNLNANLYRFDLDFVDEAKQWRLIRAAWRPAEPADFIAK